MALKLVVEGAVIVGEEQMDARFARARAGGHCGMVWVALLSFVPVQRIV